MGYTLSPALAAEFDVQLSEVSTIAGLKSLVSQASVSSSGPQLLYSNISNSGVLQYQVAQSLAQNSGFSIIDTTDEALLLGSTEFNDAATRIEGRKRKRKTPWFAKISLATLSFLTGCANVPSIAGKMQTQELHPLGYSDGIKYILTSRDPVTEDIFAKSTGWPLLLSKKAVAGLNGELSDMYFYRGADIDNDFSAEYVQYYGSTKIKFFIRIFVANAKPSYANRCVSIATAKNYVRANGWNDIEDHGTFVNHGFTAKRGITQLEVLSFVGEGEINPTPPRAISGDHVSQNKAPSRENSSSIPGCVDSIVIVKEG